MSIDVLIPMVGKAIWETLYMTFLSTLISYLIGLPLGVILAMCSPNSLHPKPGIYRMLDFIINILRSVPFLILMILLIPLTRKLVGTSIGSKATIVSLVFAAAPFVARLVESSLLEVGRGVLEAAESMGASNAQIIRKVLLGEAKPSLINGAAIATTTILGYSAMAASIGGGGLGALAIQYGYIRFQTNIMVITVILLIIIVQIIQLTGSGISKKIDKRS